MDNESNPTVRLAVCPHGEEGGANSVKHHVGAGGPSHQHRGSDVRLPLCNSPAERGDNPTLAAAPAGRLAQNGPRMEHNSRGGQAALELSGLGAPAVRLAHQPDNQCDNSTKEGGWNGNGAALSPVPPALLVSYYYLEPFLKNRELYRYRDWVMDSGAFSAHNSGVSIDLNQYIDKCLELLQSDPTLSEVFALDQIPASQSERDVAAAMEVSIHNCEEMWRQGVPAIPCYHCGEPEEALHHIASTYPKIALGGMVNKSGGSLHVDEKFVWLEQCFARVWPKKIHGFGVCAPKMVCGLPFHSVDATNWEIGPCAFGNWQKFGAMSVRGSNQDLRSQVKFYLELEAKARVRWAKEMQQLASLPPSPAVLGRASIPRNPPAEPGSAASRTEGAAGGRRIAAALATEADVKPKRKSKQVEAAAREVGEPSNPKAAGVLEDRWKNYGR